MEIERKYLVRRLPADYASYPFLEIEQGYLSTSPTLRIRRMGDAYILTVKEHRATQQGGPIINREEEFSLTAETYSHLRTKCDGIFVCKTRYRINLEEYMGDRSYRGLTAELDLFHGLHEGLMLVEVEFPDEEAANVFVKPDWFGDDVSLDPRYRNSFLSSVHNFL